MHWLLQKVSLAHGLLWAMLLFIPFSEAKQWLQSLEPLSSTGCVLQPYPCAQAAQANSIAEQQLGLSNDATAALSRSERLVHSPLSLFVGPNWVSLGYPLELSNGSPRGPPMRGQSTEDRGQ